MSQSKSINFSIILKKLVALLPTHEHDLGTLSCQYNKKHFISLDVNKDFCALTIQEFPVPEIDT